jgi:hypothetical protein
VAFLKKLLDTGCGIRDEKKKMSLSGIGHRCASAKNAVGQGRKFRAGAFGF